MEVNFSMNLALVEEIERKKAQSLASSILVEAKKIEILEQLENAITKLKESRLEIHKATQMALKMKENGNDIANQVVGTIAQIFTGNDNPWFKRARKLEQWFPKLKY
jgi:hypothetical protein